jgi:four helix bundle protein
VGLRLARDHWRPFAAGAFAQLQRSSLSVRLNIAEGYARFAPRQFRQFLTVAYGSAIETEELLDLLVEEGAIDATRGREAIRVANRCQRLLLGLLKRARDQSSS